MHGLELRNNNDLLASFAFPSGINRERILYILKHSAV